MHACIHTEILKCVCVCVCGVNTYIKGGADDKFVILAVVSDGLVRYWLAIHRHPYTIFATRITNNTALFISCVEKNNHDGQKQPCNFTEIV